MANGQLASARTNKTAAAIVPRRSRLFASLRLAIHPKNVAARAPNIADTIQAIQTPWSDSGCRPRKYAVMPRCSPMATQSIATTRQ